MAEKSHIVSALAQLSTLQAGQTISVGKSGNVTISKHRTWGEMVGYRNTDHRKQALAYIRGIFTQALTLLRTNPSDDLMNSFEPALKGVITLKETYKGDFYTIAEIDRIIDLTKRELAQVLQQLLMNPVEQNKPEVNDQICSEIIDELHSLTSVVEPATDEVAEPKKFRSDQDDEGRIPSEDAPTPDAMVPPSDRASYSESTEPQISGITLVGGRESGICRPSDDSVCVTPAEPSPPDIGNLIKVASDETVQVVLAASDEIKHQIDGLSKSQSDLTEGRDDEPILSARTETIVRLEAESRKFIKNNDSSKDTVTHVNRTSSATDSFIHEHVITDEHIVIYVGETVLPPMDSDAESTSKCPTLCACLDIARRTVAGPDAPRDGSSASRCPAFSPQESSSSETINGPPAIVRLAQAFEQWLDSVCDDESESD
jgi:hypothetical protein